MVEPNLSWYCINCGEGGDDAASACAICKAPRARLVRDDTTHKYCQRCQGKNWLTAGFCQWCGWSFKPQKVADEPAIDYMPFGLAYGEAAPPSGPEPVTAAAPSPKTDPRTRHDVFISHSSKDRQVALAVCHILEGRGVRCWMAPRDVLPGSSWDEAIVDAIDAAPVMVLVFSADSNASEQVAREVRNGVQGGAIVIPFRIQDVPPSKVLRYQIAAAHWLDALTPPIEQHIERLAETVRHFLAMPRETAATGPAATPPASSTATAGPARAPGKLSFAALDLEPQRLCDSMIGGYVVRAYLGSGGRGLVYRAINNALGRECCVKLFYPIQGSAKEIEGVVRRGIRALASLRHPRIVQVYDYAPIVIGDDYSYLLAMELIHGVPLNQWTTSQPPGNGSFPRRLSIAIELAGALRAAHGCRFLDESGFEQTGLLHGDIKPANVMIRRDDTPVLLDFMAVDSHRLNDSRFKYRTERPIELTGAFGTPGYMAPEQEEQGVVTARSDIYSLGVTLCELFFPESSVPRLEPFSDARKKWYQLRPSATDRLRELLRAMLQEDPDARPADAATVERALGAIAAVAGVRAIGVEQRR